MIISHGLVTLYVLREAYTRNIFGFFLLCKNEESKVFEEEQSGAINISETISGLDLQQEGVQYM